MDLVSKPSEPPILLPLGLREIRVPLPLTLGLVFGGWAVGAWWVRPDFQFMASGTVRAAESGRVAWFLFVVAAGLGAAATLLLAYGIQLLTVRKPRVAEACKKHWGEAKEEISPKRWRNSTPGRRWLFLCGLAGVQVLLIFAKGPFFASKYWLWWGACVSGFVLGAAVAYEAAHRWRFSRSVFRMQSEFGVIGGTLQGCVCLRPGVNPKRGFRVRLRGVETTTGRGSTSEDVWLDEAVIVAPLPEAGGGCAVPVYFEIPDHCPESGSVRDHDSRVDWYVDVSADTPAINCRISFEVPVRRAEKNKRQPASSRRSPLTEFEREVDGSRLYDNPRIRMRTLPGGDTEYYFPTRPALGLLLVCVMVVVALASNALALGYKDPWVGRAIVPIGMALATGLIVTTALVIRNLRSTRIQTGSGRLILTENWLGFKRRRSFDVDDIDAISSIDLYWNMLSEDRVYYDLVLKRSSGKKLPLVTMLRGKPESRWIMEQMRREVFPPDTSFGRRCQDLERFAKAGLHPVNAWTLGPVERTPTESLIAK